MLIGIEQPTEYHKEGDVYAHTMMVTKKAYEISNEYNLNKENRFIIIVAAILHDIGKPHTFTIDNGTITFPNHSKVGARIARDFLFKKNIEFSLRESIVGLIKNHQIPFWLIDDEKSIGQYKLLKAKVETYDNLKKLWMLAQCDILGRICDNVEKANLNINLFNELAIEYKDIIFDTQYNRFNYFYRFAKYLNGEKLKPSVYDKYFDSTKCTVTIMSGLPGMGKDTYISIHNKEGLPVISLDDIRVELNIKPTDEQGLVVNTAKDRAKKYLAAGQSFIWNATNITKDIRDGLIDIIVEYNGKPNIVYVEKPYDIWLKQNKNREKAVPESALMHMLSRLQVPNVTECVELFYE